MSAAAATLEQPDADTLPDADDRPAMPAALAEVISGEVRHATIDSLDADEYHRGPGISRSGLDLIARSPAHFLHAKKNPKGSTPQKQLGTALHSLILEPELFDSVACKSPKFDKRTNKGKTAAAEFEEVRAGRIAIVPDDWDRLHYMADAVREHPIAGVLLEPSSIAVERTHYWRDEESDELCKCRPDAWNNDHDLIVDLKTTENASEDAFRKSVENYGYHIQNAFYQDGASACGFTPQVFLFCAVESSPPFGVGLFDLDPGDIHKSRVMYRRNLATYSICRRADSWPNYPPKIRRLNLRKWAFATPAE